MNTDLFRKLKITDQELLSIDGADIIVCSAQAQPKHGQSGTLDYRIYSAAGEKEMQEEREKGGYLKCTECYSTNAYKLNAKGIKKVIHVNVPSYYINPKAPVDTNVKLMECYYNVLREATLDEEPHLVAFPLLGTGKKGFTYPAAVGLMQIGVSSFFEDYPDAQVGVVISIIDSAGFQYASFSNQVLNLVNPAESNYSVEHESSRIHDMESSRIPEPKLYDDFGKAREQLEAAKEQFQAQRQVMLRAISESWRGYEHSLGAKILHYQSVSNLDRKEILERANISSRQYNDVINIPHHNCSFNTIIGLCVAFDLTLEESYDLLKSARMTFDEYDQGCQIIMRAIENRNLSPIEKRDQINNDLHECKIDYVFCGKNDRRR